ncbi:hypothetical protein [Pseudanabaena sp. PCC 6802]|uniref:hypothetical protein n=1 Tax=Pseudanabaena sp. PCC 6802 TaxID=118173 RepID=UPI000349AF7E|nr:hypothetical protein [Pseudanabaena sp. PCC 6802]
MVSSPQDSAPDRKFLTPEEAHAVDGAMLSTMEKFMTRITISSVRVLSHIAQSYGLHVEELQTSQIVAWIESDAKIRREQGEAAAFLQWSSGSDRDVELDFADTREDEVTGANLTSYEKFLTRMTISAKQASIPIAKAYDLHVEQLSAAQIIAWFEQDARRKREGKSDEDI